MGTTFSLDLHALLVVPLSFAFFDYEGSDADPTRDPIALLEAVRRHATSMHIFCQAGQIGAVGKDHAVLAYLEDSVFGAIPPDSTGIFHPKVWAIRYTAEDEPPLYRVLCLSRNLTFDRSWDTALVLEGHPREKGGTPARELNRRNRPLSAFIRAMPQLVPGGIPANASTEIEQLADDLLEVDFTYPDHVASLAFWPIGVPDTPSRWPFDESHRVTVVSPFLTQGALTRLRADTGEVAIVSRAESFDALGRDTVDALGPAYVMNANTEPPAEAQDESHDAVRSEAVAERPDRILRGLHAKAYLVETGRKVSVFTGSANATDAAFSINVEFLVEMTGSSRRMGSKALLEPGGGDPTTFGDLLEGYRPQNAEPLEPSIRERLEEQLERASRSLAGRRYVAQVSELSAESYRVELSTEALPKAASKDITISCWPIAVPGAEQSIQPAAPWSITFEPVSFEGLTAFYAFRLVAREEGEVVEIVSVVRAELVGAPEDRHQRILASLLEDRGKVMRYLLFLLSDPTSDPDAHSSVIRMLGHTGDGEGSYDVDLPVLETMIRTLARAPARLDDIARLIEDLHKSGQAEALLPPGFQEVWEPIWTARQRSKT